MTIREETEQIERMVLSKYASFQIPPWAETQMTLNVI